jgi:alpha-1,3-mannosyltransferase
VVHVVRQFAPSVGGLEDAVLNLAHQQRRRGLKPRVVTLDRVFTKRDVRLPSQDVVEGLPVVRLPWRGSSRYPLAPAVLSAVRHADLVHVHGIDFFFDFLAATQILHRRRMVASTHGGFFHTQFAAGLKRLWFGSVTRASSHAYDTIVACSENDARLFSALPAARLETVENGVNLRKFAAAPAGERDPRRLVTFGRFAAHKRITALFDVLGALLCVETGWHLVVAGAPADQDLAVLQDACARAGVAAHVRFVLAPSDADIARELAGATWFACASAHEGFGLAAAEAAAAGLIPVLSQIAPFERLIARLGDGVVIDPRLPHEAARAVLSAAANGQLAARGAAVAVAAQAYDWRAAADGYLGVYQRVLQASPLGEVV